jgi:hypothetical protein
MYVNPVDGRGNDATCFKTGTPAARRTNGGHIVYCATVQGAIDAAMHWELSRVVLEPGLYNASHCNAIVNSSQPFAFTAAQWESLVADKDGGAPQGSPVIDCAFESRALTV